MESQQLITCENCGCEMQSVYRDWQFRCGKCQLESSTLQYNQEREDHNTFDKLAVIESLEPIRKSNWINLFEKLGGVKAIKNSKMLDVGCATGQFLQVSREYGLNIEAIEPDPHFAKIALSNGFRVREGFFPNELADSEKFDYIFFNDVFEHIRGAGFILDAVKKHLSSQGRLILALPNSRGLIYRLSCFFNSFGIRSPFDRMWQVGFPSPHIYYFNSQNLKELCEKHGFRVEHCYQIPMYTFKGLWTRVRSNKEKSFLYNAVVWLALVGLILVQSFFESDSMLLVAQNDDFKGHS